MGFFQDYVIPALIIIGESLLLMVVLLIFVAYLLYADRKIWAAVQMRRGPNVVGPWGLLQSFADLLKFVFKEPVVPSGSNKGIFLLAPLVTTTLALSAWAVVPVDAGWVIADINVGILYIFAISSLGVYGIIMAGWASNSKYPFLGALRSAAQMVSYEVSIGFVIITVLLCVGSLNLTDIVIRAGGRSRHARSACPTASSTGTGWRSCRCSSSSSSRRWPRPTGRPSIWSRPNRSWLPASWSNIRSTPYMLFMLGEYVAIVLMCALTTILFLGGWLPPVAVAPFTWVPGVVWFVLKVSLRLLHVRDGEGVRAALPLRPADAARLEGLPADLAVHGRRRRRRPADHRLGCGCR